MPDTDYIKHTMMVTRYRLFLYKLFTIPNKEGIQSSVFSAFLGMTMFQMVNLVSVFMFIRIFYPMDLRETSKFVLVMIFISPPFIFNYYFIYFKNGYKKILKDFSHIDRGSLKHIGIYAFLSIIVFIVSVYLIRE
jgi:hypothetical protein